MQIDADARGLSRENHSAETLRLKERQVGEAGRAVLAVDHSTDAPKMPGKLSQK